MVAHKLKKIEKIFEDYPEIGYVFSDAIIINKYLQNCGYTIWERIPFNLHQRDYFKQGYQVAVLLKHNVIIGATMAFRKELKKWILPIPKQWVHDAWIALLASSAQMKGALIEETLIKYRQHSNQLIGTAKPSFITQLQKACNTKSESYGAMVEKIENVLDRLFLIGKLKADTELLLSLR